MTLHISSDLAPHTNSEMTPQTALKNVTFVETHELCNKQNANQIILRQNATFCFVVKKD